MYKNNYISTSKYNFLNFIPVNLFKQLSQMANFYFLILCGLELYPPITDSPGYPGLLPPLTFVVSLSMLKDLYEDIKRHKSDNRENNSKVKVGKQFKKKRKKVVTVTNKFVEKSW